MELVTDLTMRFVVQQYPPSRHTNIYTRKLCDKAVSACFIAKLLNRLLGSVKVWFCIKSCTANFIFVSIRGAPEEAGGLYLPL
jgi:hypothetical protein